MSLFKDRYDAGRLLASELKRFKEEDLILLALPRGGVPVAYEAAKKLGAPLDIFIVRKIGVPGREELAMGAIAIGGVKILNDNVINILNLSEETIQDAIQKEKVELQRREKEYRGSRPFPIIENRTVVLIDDGLATGASMKAAVKALKKHNPSKIIVAVPTASEDTCNEFQSEVDEIICAYTPAVFRGVSEWYDDFSQTTDEEVMNLLEDSYRRRYIDVKA